MAIWEQNYIPYSFSWHQGGATLLPLTGREREKMALLARLAQCQSIIRVARRSWDGPIGTGLGLFQSHETSEETGTVSIGRVRQD
jgi:hypothetical protein